MSTSEVAAARRQAGRILLGQLVATIAVALICWPLAGARASVSALMGGGIGIVTTGYMAFAMLKREGRSASSVATSFFLGWVVKVLFTIALLVIAFRSKSVEPLPLLVGYAVTYFAYGLAALPQRRS